MNMSYLDRYKGYPSRIEGILLEEFGVLDDAPAIADGGIISGKIIGEEEGDKVLTAELRVDTADDLPAYDSIEGYILRGCIALVVHTGDIWAQDSTGEWFNQTSPEAVNASVQSSTRATAPEPADMRVDSDELRKEDDFGDLDDLDDDDDFDDDMR